MTQYALVADLGGTQLRVALVDGDGNISQRHATPTLAHQGRDDVVNRFIASLDQVATSADRRDIVGIGVSIAGPTDPETGTMYDPPNLPGWHGFSAKPILEERLSLKAWFANDATLGALAEFAYGAGRGYKHMIYMTVSTGIGGGIVIDGKLYNGGRGFAGELGHMTIDRDGPKCNCGNTGCLEILASGTAVAVMARERLVASESSALQSLSGGDLSEVDARMVAEAANSGDSLSRAVMQEAATNLGIGIVSLLHIFDPEIIVIGGGMSQNFQLLLPGITEQIDRRAMAQYKGRMPVVKSELGDDVSLLGAAALAFDAHERDMA